MFRVVEVYIKKKYLKGWFVSNSICEIICEIICINRECFSLYIL